MRSPVMPEIGGLAGGIDIENKDGCRHREKAAANSSKEIARTTV